MPAVLIAGALVVAVSPATSAAPVKAGARCTTVGATAVDAQGRALVCVKGKKGKRWAVRKPSPSPSPSPSPTSSPEPPYMWMGDWKEGWKKIREAPTCPSDLSTLFTHMPFDLSDVTRLRRPGYENLQQGYKAHGWLHYADGGMPDDDEFQRIEAPADGWLFSIARYRETYTPGNDQVILDFFTECGVMWRFDHLRDGKLAPSLQAIVDKVELREDTVGIRVTPVRVKAGELIATAVGVTDCIVTRPGCMNGGGPNLSVDFGIYDPRQLNAAAQADPAFLSNLAWDGAYKGIGLCWPELFPAWKSDLDRLATGTSDYCRTG